MRKPGLGLTLSVMLLFYIFNFLDRQLVVILAEPISKELGLSDTDIGILTGLSFALLYSILGVPIARYADRPGTDRVRLLAIAAAVWSIATALCGITRNFTQLLIARVWVGIGEAGGTAPAHSLISDYAPPEKRARALSIFTLGPPIGALLGMVIGGLLVEPLGWRMTFVVVGLPGVGVALLLWALLRDPRRERFVDTAPHAGLPLREVARVVWSSKAMRMLMLTAALGPFTTYGIVIWTAVFFQRTHGLTPGQTGLWFGLINGIASLIGVWLGGQIGDRYRARGKQHLLTGPSIMLMLCGPFLLAAALAGDWRIAMALFFPAILLNWAYNAPFYSAVQGLVPPEARATAAASILLIQNLIGLGVGPVALGFLSDSLKPTYGADSLRFVLAVIAVAAVGAGLLLWRARKHLPTELDRHAPAV